MCRIPKCDLLAAIFSGLNRTWSVVRFVAIIRIAGMFLTLLPQRINGYSRMGYVVGYILNIWRLSLRLSFFLSFILSFLLSFSLLVAFKQTHDQLGWCIEEKKLCNWMIDLFNPLNPELNPICYLLALLAHHFLHVGRIRVKSLTLRLLMSYIWSAYSWCF